MKKKVKIIKKNAKNKINYVFENDLNLQFV